MDWLSSKTTALAGGCFVLVALQGYGLMSMRSALEPKNFSETRSLRLRRTGTRSLKSLCC